MTIIILHGNRQQKKMWSIYSQMAIPILPTLNHLKPRGQQKQYAQGPQVAQRDDVLRGKDTNVK